VISSLLFNYAKIPSPLETIQMAMQQCYLITMNPIVFLSLAFLHVAFLTHISSVLVTVVTFGLYPYIESEKMEPAKVFAGLALFNQLTVPLFIFPITVPVVIDAIVSFIRLESPHYTT